MNVNQGDLAWIAKAPFGGPVGVVVEIDRAYGYEERFGFAWYVKSNKPIPTRLMGNRTEGIIVPDDWLRRINGDPSMVEQPLVTNVPEALRLALGIEARVWA